MFGEKQLKRTNGRKTKLVFTHNFEKPLVDCIREIVSKIHKIRQTN